MPNEKLKKCLDEGKRSGERHQGLRKVTPSAENAQAHLAKSLHNFEAMTRFHDLGYTRRNFVPPVQEELSSSS